MSLDFLSAASFRLTCALKCIIEWEEVSEKFTVFTLTLWIPQVPILSRGSRQSLATTSQLGSEYANPASVSIRGKSTRACVHFEDKRPFFYFK